MAKLFNTIRVYVMETVSEMKKVTWTRRKDLFASTGVVIFLSLLVAAFIGLVDFIFSRLLTFIIH